MGDSLTKDEILARLGRLAPDVAALGRTIEAERCLPKDLVDKLRATGCFGMTLPGDMGGAELSPLEQFEVCEAAARLDASVGWCVMIGSDAGYYSAFFDDTVTRELWSRPDFVTAGWVMPAGRAREVEGGYRVDGRWQFGSGCTHADVFIGGCVVTDADGNPKPSGRPGVPVETVVVAMPASAVEVQDTWYTTGLAGSGSHDYVATDVHVPAEHSFDFYFGRPRRPGPLYAYIGLLYSNLAAVPIGAAQAAIDTFVELANTKVVMPSMALMREEARVQQAAAEAQALVRSGRAWAVEVLGELWDRLRAGDLPDEQLRARYRLSAMHACRSARKAVESLYDAAGSSAIYATSPLDRAMRDQMTMAAHIIASSRNLEPAGRVLLGLPADSIGY
jgi:alkylation response protein AidB-like acyl-CoA dehydrogenase